MDVDIHRVYGARNPFFYTLRSDEPYGQTDRHPEMVKAAPSLVVKVIASMATA